MVETEQTPAPPVTQPPHYPAEFKALVDRASKKIALARKVHIWGLWCSFGTIALVAGLQLAGFGVKSSLGSLVNLIGVLAAAFIAAGTKKVMINASKSMSIQYVGNLVEGQWAGEPEVRKLCRDAMYRLLPQLTPEDADLFDEHQRQALYKMLEPPAISMFESINVENLSAVLNAIHAVGDRNAIQPLEAFQQRMREEDTKVTFILADRALEILPDIRLRAAREIISCKVEEVRARSELDAEKLQQLHVGACHGFVTDDGLD